MSRHLALVLVLGLASAAAWGQDLDPFAAYHRALAAAADSLLAPPAPSAPGVTSAAPTATPRGTRESIRPAADRMRRLRPLLEPILAQEGVPPQLTALALVESGGNAFALSPRGARGLWQFMPETARRYGLAVDGTRDERLDLLKSTRAAARYLRDLHTRFGDWRLTLAAYNAGASAVERASRRAGASDFYALSAQLPVETRSYVPAVLVALRSAVAPLVDSPPRFHIVFASPTDQISRKDTP